MPENLKKLYETLLKLASKQNMQAFFKSLPYLAKSKRGFNLFEIGEDAQGGVTVGTVSDDGFGDPFNHGLRIFCNTDDYMLIGTANPFYGTQLWRVANTLFPVHVSAGEGGAAFADKTTDVGPGATVTLTATPDEGYRFAGWKVNQGGVAVASDNTFVMPSHSNRAGLHRQQHLCGRQPAVGRPRVHRCIDHRPGDGRGSRQGFGSHDDRRQAQARLTCAP